MKVRKLPKPNLKVKQRITKRMRNSQFFCEMSDYHSDVEFYDNLKDAAYMRMWSEGKR